MGTRDLDKTYFSLHPEKLFNLRQSLQEDPNLDLNDLLICKLIRHEALGLTSIRSKSENYSIGQFIQSYGGIQKFLDTPAYRICPPVAAIALATQYVSFYVSFYVYRFLLYLPFPFMFTVYLFSFSIFSFKLPQ